MGRKLKYNKSDGTIESAIPQSNEEDSAVQNTVPVSEMSVIGEANPLPPAYRKEDGHLSYSLICVISGGTRRERTFLVELEKKHTFKSLEILFVSSVDDEGGLTPRMMQAAYEYISAEGCIRMPGRLVRLETVDEIYMLTDVDHYEADLRKILSEHNTISPRWIISNPDFEIWLYYCYRNKPEEELTGVVNALPSQRSSLLKSINGTFNNGGGLDTRKAFEHLVEGISHSRAHYREKDGIPLLLSTQMHFFAEDVLLRLGDEYRVFMEQKQAFRNSMNRMNQNKEKLEK